MADKVLITTPDFHPRQKEIYKNRRRFNAVRCGRRWGKTKMVVGIAGSAAAHKLKVGIFTPEYKQLSEPFEELQEILHPIRARVSRSDGLIRTLGGGAIDFWHVNDNPLAGRGREYDIILVDEGAFTKTPGMLDIWQKSMKPTLLTRRGTAWVFSTPMGIDAENFFYKCCRDPSYGFKEFHAPTSDSPYIPLDELEKERLTAHPLVFQQEYLAEFVDWSGVAFFALDKWLVDGIAPPMPEKCDAVFAVIDTAIKTGKDHDGTAVVYFSVSQYYGHPVMILDYEKIQIEGSLLETWLPTVYQRLEVLAAATGARQGHLGAFIEDKVSGTILLQQAARYGWPATAIDSKLTAVGKDERAISVSGYHYNGKCKISSTAYDKLITFKGATRNHLITEVTGYRIGDKDAAKRADDLTDAYTYGLSIALGNRDGY